MGTWAVAKAKAQFSELIDTAREKGAQEITRNGKLVGVLVSPEEWQKRGKTGASRKARTTSEIFRNSPLVGSGLKIDRARLQPRAKTFVSGWDALAPSSGATFDVEFPRLGSKPRAAKF